MLVPARPAAFLAACAALVFALMSLTSCVVPIVAGSAASAGYVAGQERDFGTQVNDTVVKTRITEKWAGFNRDMAQQLSLSVYDGRVLITGLVSNPEWKTDSVRLAWEVKGVKEVNSEIDVSANQGIADATRDEVITTRLRSAILLDGQIRSVNYTIDTVNGAVFLSGSARSQGELDKVTNYARNIPNVKRVVSYVRIRPGEPALPPGAAAPVTGAAQDSPAPAPPMAPAAPANAAPAPTGPAGSGKIEVQPLQ